MSPLQVCLVGLNWEAEVVARFDCLCIVKNPMMRHTSKAELRDPKLEVMEQR